MRFMNTAASDWRTKMNTVYNPAHPEDTLFVRKNGGESRLKSVQSRGQGNSSGQYIR
jgi:hypothetical protein